MMKRFCIVPLLLLGGCLLNTGCLGIKRIEIGKVQEPPIVDVNIGGAAVKIYAISATIEYECGDEEPSE